MVSLKKCSTISISLNMLKADHPKNIQSLSMSAILVDRWAMGYNSERGQPKDHYIKVWFQLFKNFRGVFFSIAELKTRLSEYLIWYAKCLI